jgi:hypothetical protein
MRRSTLFISIALVPALAQIVCFAVALGLRLGYPMDLEWLEGPQLYEAFRFVHGLPVYGPPTQGFVPCPYPPLFHLVVGAVGWCFGFDYWTGRVVSGVSIAIAIAVQSSAVIRAAPSRRLGWVLATMGAAGVAASYRPLEASMDLARVDMMGFAVVGVAAWVSRRPPLRPIRSVVLGLLLCASVYTKQTNLFYCAWIVAFLARRDRRAAATAVTVAAGLGVVALVALERWTSGWFWTWMTVMRHHGLVPAKCAIGGAIVAICAAALGSVLAAFRRRGWLSDESRFWCGMLGASIPACVGPWLTGGGWVNNLIGLTIVAILVVLMLVCDAVRGMRAVAAVGAARSKRADPNENVGLAGAVERSIVAVLSALLLGALYDPMSNVPNAARVHDAEALHTIVRSLDGDVLVPMYPFVAPRDGKTTPQISLVAYLDTIGPGRLNADPGAALRAKQPAWVILCGHSQEDDVPGWLGPEYTDERLDLRVQALKEATGERMMLLRRVHSEVGD